MPVDKSLVYTIALSHCPAVGPVHYGRLMRQFGSSERAWNARREDLIAGGFADGFVNALLSTRAALDPQQAFDRLGTTGVQAILLNDPRFPSQLADLHDPPYILFYRGALPVDGEQCVAVIGTRRCSLYGIHTTKMLVAEIAREKCTIVSGLALGIDAHAARAALDAHTKTIAVLGGGVDADAIGPRQNFFLAEEIIGRGGCVLSEYPPGTRPSKTHFPMRNRIVAGLSAGVLVIEAPLKSGALITADIALNVGREVFAVPGNITSPLSQGTNMLIQNGAHVALSGRDVTETLGFAAPKNTRPASHSGGSELTPYEQQIHAALEKKSLHAEEIARACQLDMQAANSTLLLMEMKGLVAHIGGMVYRATKP